MSVSRVLKAATKSRACLDNHIPLYSIPHFSFTMIGLPVNPFKKGFGLTGTVCKNTHHRQITPKDVAATLLQDVDDEQ